jgi:hypothetical protein
MEGDESDAAVVAVGVLVVTRSRKNVDNGERAKKLAIIGVS